MPFCATGALIAGGAGSATGGAAMTARGWVWITTSGGGAVTMVGRISAGGGATRSSFSFLGCSSWIINAGGALIGGATLHRQYERQNHAHMDHHRDQERAGAIAPLVRAGAAARAADAPSAR